MWQRWMLIPSLMVLCVSIATGMGLTKYNSGDEMIIWANKMVPYSNPSESYQFFDAVPWPRECVPERMEYHSMQLGELLQGDRLVKTGFSVKFRRDQQKTKICGGVLTPEDVNAFRLAVTNNYHYDLMIDELAIELVPLGRDLVEAAPELMNQVFVYSTLHFALKYNENHVVEVDVIAEDEVEFVHGRQKEFSLSYSVTWYESDKPTEHRLNRYIERDRLKANELRTHWLSVINAAAAAVLLFMLLLSIFGRTVNRDFARYSASVDVEDLEHDELMVEEDERGWRIVKSDVFRFPQYKELFCAVVGTGAQVLVLLIVLVLLATTSNLYHTRRGSFNTALLVTFALTNLVAGYTSAKLYTQMDGRNLALNTISCLTISLGPIYGVWTVLDVIAKIYGSTMALSFWVMASVISITGLIAIPATFFGAVLGRRSGKSGFNAPIRTAKARREIPKPPVHLRWEVQMVLAGLLPFGAVLVELAYVFASVWGHKTFSLHGIGVIVIIIVLAVTELVCAVFTYYQLCAEDHEWWWNSICNGGSTGIYLFLYSIYYLMMKSNLSGFLQVSYFLGYMFSVSYACFLMLGSVGYHASVTFVRRLYKSIKCD
uniref:Transmembrane 9 superfamily member n=7 Tax=Rhodosorus marinus TaxID=101924 RepID=A0A7S3AAW2_9RHOD|mmetsp:Transcript_746/g.1811  ORF Transcript_746/g.1811 Transcript_746/m.1811 type:complete len:601 (+) Transcript_746:81-1883(+)